MDFKQLVTKLMNLENLPCFVYKRKDGGIVLGDIVKQKYWLLFIQNYGYTTRPNTPYTCDFYSLSTNASFGVNYEDAITSKAETIYQIYGLNFPEEFAIDELCKKKGDMSFFQSYFRDEIFTSDKALKLKEEFIAMVSEIEKIDNVTKA